MTLPTDRTTYADVNELLNLLLSGIHKILPDKLLDLYLYGSLVIGDFDIQCSDIDLLAATSSDIDDEDFAHLQKMHADLATNHPNWGDGIEVAYLSATALKTYHLHSNRIAVISPGEPFHIKEAGEDWLMNWFMVRESSFTLFGTSPQTLIDYITKERLLQTVRKHVQDWRQYAKNIRDHGSQAYAILTLCRGLCTLKKGESVSKKQAALWAAQEFPEWSRLIQNALLWRKAPRDEQLDHVAVLPETLRFVDFVVSQCVNGGAGY